METRLLISETASDLAAYPGTCNRRSGDTFYFPEMLSDFAFPWPSLPCILQTWTVGNFCI